MRSAVTENISTAAIGIATDHRGVTEIEMAIDTATETGIATRNDTVITDRDTTTRQKMDIAINDPAILGRIQNPRMIQDTGTVAGTEAGPGKASANAIAR